MRSCVFCGGLPVTREHVFPQWLRQFSGPESFIKRAGAYKPNSPELVVRKDSHGKYVEVMEQRGTKIPNLHEITVKAVCASCNNGWMSALEGDARRIIKKLAVHQNMVLDRSNKATLAAWAHKCFLMYDLYQDSRDRAFADDDLRSFMRTRRPPATARLYIGITNSPFGPISLWHQPRLFIPAGTAPDPQSVLGTNNMCSSSLCVQGIYFIEQYFRPDIRWNDIQRQAIDRPSRISVESIPTGALWPLDSKPLRWPPRVTTLQEFERGRLALHNVLATFPTAIERSNSLK